jgi:hypothetical protein
LHNAPIFRSCNLRNIENAGDKHSASRADPIIDKHIQRPAAAGDGILSIDQDITVNSKPIYSSVGKARDS